MAKPTAMVTYQVPAIRYTTFIEAYEAAVTKAQEKIRAIEAGQGEYLACVEAIRSHPLPNDGKLELVENGALISIAALPKDSRGQFDDLAAAVGAELRERGLRASDVPSVRTRSVSWPELSYVFSTRRRDGSNGSVRIDVRVPKLGLIDAEVHNTIEHYPMTSYEIVPRRLRPITEYEARLRPESDEVIF